MKCVIWLYMLIKLSICCHFCSYLECVCHFYMSDYLVFGHVGSHSFMLPQFSTIFINSLISVFVSLGHLAHHAGSSIEANNLTFAPNQNYYPEEQMRTMEPRNPKLTCV